MPLTVSFADKQVFFTDRAPDGADFTLRAEPNGKIGRAKVLKILEKHNALAVLSSEPEAAFEAFAADFVRVEAAGGVVVDDCGACLMILRNARWDLPKGHWEPGETIEECAVREVEEETGVRGVRIVRPLCRTLHAYSMRGRWELKCTHWFAMRMDGNCALRPQREEGIERVSWCPSSQLNERLQTTFPTIRRVMECLQPEQ